MTSGAKQLGATVRDGRWLASSLGCYPLRVGVVAAFCLSACANVAGTTPPPTGKAGAASVVIRSLLDDPGSPTGGASAKVYHLPVGTTSFRGVVVGKDGTTYGTLSPSAPSATGGTQLGLAMTSLPAPGTAVLNLYAKDAAGVETLVVSEAWDPHGAFVLRFDLPAPTLTSVAPTSGPLAGGGALTLIGTGFAGATRVTVGGQPATITGTPTDTQLTVSVPAGSLAGPADVVVTTPGGTVTSKGAYRYDAASADGTVTAEADGTTVFHLPSNTVSYRAVVTGADGSTLATLGPTSPPAVAAGGQAASSLIGLTFTALPDAGTATLAIYTSDASKTEKLSVKAPWNLRGRFILRFDLAPPAPPPPPADVTVSTEADGTTVYHLPSDTVTYRAAVTGTDGTILATLGPANPAASSAGSAGSLAGLTFTTLPAAGAATLAIYTTNASKAERQSIKVPWKLDGRFILRFDLAPPTAPPPPASDPVTTREDGAKVYHLPSNSVTYRATVTGKDGTALATLGPASALASGAQAQLAGLTFTALPAAGTATLKIYATDAAKAEKLWVEEPFDPRGRFILRFDLAPPHADTLGGVVYTSPVSNTAAPTVATVTAAAPHPVAGGNTVTITGTNLTGATAVTFGGTPGTAINVASSTQLTVKAPAGTGTVDVAVTTPGGTVTANGAYHYAPTIFVPFLPPFEPEAGGLPVAIAGTGFTGATSVTFGGTPGTGLLVANDGALGVVAPAGVGTVAVAVTTPDGTATAAAAFTYLPPPVITGVTTVSGSAVAGYTLTLTGTGFTGVTDVGVQDPAGFPPVLIPATILAVPAPTDTSITVTVPPNAPGTMVNVTVTTPGGAATRVNGFTY